MRAAEPKGFEVFLTQRPDSMPFLGGRYCYPGGSVTKEDCSPPAIARCTGLSLIKHARSSAPILVRAKPWDFGSRLFASFRRSRDSARRARSPASAFPTVARGAKNVVAMHDALLKNSLSFISLLESEELRCDLASLGYFLIGRPPLQVSQRFDTRFFVAALPPDQIPLESSYEVTHSLWLAPERAMQLHERGQLPMIFPTFVSLRTLADFETLESVLKEFHAGTVTPVSSKPSTLTKQ